MRERNRNLIPVAVLAGIALFVACAGHRIAQYPFPIDAMQNRRRIERQTGAAVCFLRQRRQSVLGASGIGRSRRAALPHRAVWLPEKPVRKRRQADVRRSVSTLFILRKYDLHHFGQHDAPGCLQYAGQQGKPGPGKTIVERSDRTRTRNRQPHPLALSHGKDFSVNQWVDQMRLCNSHLTQPDGPGVTGNQVIGFRTPFLEYGDHTFTAAQKTGFVYDCSIDERLPEGHGWPQLSVALQAGSRQSRQRHHIQATRIASVREHPGLWELPVYAFIVPPDELCEK